MFPSIPRAAVAAILLAASVALNCDGDAPEPVAQTHGALALAITGLPAAHAADIALAGPGSFTKAITAPGTTGDLVPGNYAILANVVGTATTSYQPEPDSQAVDIVAGRTALAMVAYTSAPFALRLQPIAQGLANPVFLTAPPGDARLFVVEQPGRIRIVKNGALLAVPFLDVTARVRFGGERGLLSMAFDPAYATNGRFYIYYTDLAGDIVVDRHTVSANADIANTAFQNVITIAHRQASNHNGGLVMFGTDGNLYIGTGDGGGAGDQLNNGQNINALLGKLLRVDVASLPYTIPADNPFVGRDGADEIWATGLRNPWRFAFDGTGAAARIYIADVGQGAIEEINVQPVSAAGRNYGWRLMEGTRCYNPSSGCNTGGLTLPTHEYTHADGCSITGGFVYRGAAIPEIRGHYFYSDYCNGWVRSFRVVNSAAVDHTEWPVGNVGNIASFGVDGAGELHVLSNNGRVYKFVKQ